MDNKKMEHKERYREIGYRIAQCRKYKNMTQAQLAKKLHTSRQHIGAIEAPNVRRKLSMDLLFDIADALGVEPRYFLECQDIPFIDTSENDKK